MFEIKNKKEFFTLIFFILLGIGILISTFLEHGFNDKGRFGYIGGFIAISYGLLRNKLLKGSKR
jgi:hypothetical protein